MALIIAQITDLHIGAPATGRSPDNGPRLVQVLDAIKNLQPPPDMVIATGDLTQDGRPEQYRDLKSLTANFPIPIHWMLGNHDDKAAFDSVFAAPSVCENRLSSVIETETLRSILLDSCGAGRHAGHFDAAQASWLDKTLAEKPDTPTLIAIHHPPIFTGIDWMPVNNQNGWETELAKAIAPHRQIIKLICGHLHRPADAMWNRLPVTICSSTSPQLALDLRKIDPAHPDGRALMVDEAPAFAVHIWTGTSLISHHMRTDHSNTLIDYTSSSQGMVVASINN